MQTFEFERIKCQICSSSDEELITKFGQFGLPTQVVVCRNCGFSYLNPRWTKERYDKFYKSEYDKYYRPDVLNRSQDDSRFKNIKNILTRITCSKMLKDQPHNVLDIGCGMGDALTYLKSKVYTVAAYYAIEPSDYCCEHLKKNGIHVISQDVDAEWAVSYSNKFDFVIMRHVLEHFLNPLGVLKSVARALSDNGIAYIAVPNAMRPKSPLLSYYFRVVHVNYFSSGSLTNLLRMAGLEALISVEGDKFDPYELYIVCKKIRETASPVIDKELALRQTAAYRKRLIFEPYFYWKDKLIKMIKGS